MSKLLDFLLLIVLLSILSIGLINSLLYSDCNRDNRDCFLIQNLWSKNV